MSSKRNRLLKNPNIPERKYTKKQWNEWRKRRTPFYLKKKVVVR